MTAADPGAGARSSADAGEPAGRPTFVTPQQAVVHALFVRHRSMSVVARTLGISQIRVREALVQHERNVLRDAGMNPPPLREMLRGDVAGRFGISKEEAGGRPAKHASIAVPEMARPTEHEPRSIAAEGPSTRRLVVTAVEVDGRLHLGFWKNLLCYVRAVDAELVVVPCGVDMRRRAVPEECRAHVADGPIVAAGLIDVAVDEVPPIRLARPLEMLRHRNEAQWTIVPSPEIQLETLPRIRSDGLRIQLTTGAATIPRSHGGRRPSELGAVVVELKGPGRAHVRHLLADVSGDGSFQDLDVRVGNGMVRRGCRVEGLTFGDVHHAHLDSVVAAATWGIGADGTSSTLVDRLRPRTMIFHDVCDFDARNPHERGDHLRRFGQFARGGGDVRAELAAAAGFLASTNRPWSRSVVVGSNHDEMLVRWLRESDFREDPANAEFFLETSLALHRRIAGGGSTDGFFEEVLRGLAHNTLADVRFLRADEGLKIAGVEVGMHGHLGADGRPGDVRFFERLGIKATLGHTHRPLTRGGICCAGVSASGMSYARGPITCWAPGHVVTYASGARQHLIMSGGAFHA